MTEISASWDDADGSGRTPTGSDDGDPGRDRSLVTDGGTEAADSADGDDEYYGMQSYNFAWYWTKQIGWRRALLGTALLATSFLVVPGLVLLGYAYRVGRATARGEPAPPAPGDWGELAKDGARFLVVVVPAAVLFVIPILGAYVGIALISAFLGTGRLTAVDTHTSFVRLLLSVSYVARFIEYLVYISGIWILTVLAIGVGWVLGPGFAVVSSGAFFGYVYHDIAAGDATE